MRRNTLSFNWLPSCPVLGARAASALALLLLLLLPGCRPSSEPPPASSASSSAPAALAAADGAGPAAAVVRAGEKLKVAFVYVGPVGDAGWTWAHDQAR